MKEKCTTTVLDDGIGGVVKTMSTAHSLRDFADGYT